MSKPTEAQLSYCQYACKICTFRSPTVGELFTHIKQVHEKLTPPTNNRVPLILPPQHPPPPPPPPEVDVEDFIQYNTIIRPLEGGEIEEEPIVIEDPEPVEASQPGSSILPVVYGCPLCKFESRNEGKVQRHIDRHDSEQEVPSSNLAPAPANFIENVKVDNNEVLPADGIYECGLCHDQTASIEEMIAHMVNVHQIQ